MFLVIFISLVPRCCCCLFCPGVLVSEWTVAHEGLMTKTSGVEKCCTLEASVQVWESGTFLSVIVRDFVSDFEGPGTRYFIYHTIFPSVERQDLAFRRGGWLFIFMLSGLGGFFCYLQCVFILRIS